MAENKIEKEAGNSLQRYLNPELSFALSYGHQPGDKFLAAAEKLTLSTTIQVQKTTDESYTKGHSDEDGENRDNIRKLSRTR